MREPYSRIRDVQRENARGIAKSHAMSRQIALRSALRHVFLVRRFVAPLVTRLVAYSVMRLVMLAWREMSVGAQTASS
jgi:hypothetical protein